MRSLARTTIWLALTLVGCSPSAPSPSVDLTGTWAGTASDAGPVRWVITQTGSAVTGTMTLLDASTGAIVVSGSISGTTVTSDASQTLTFQQRIVFFQFPSGSPYYAMGFDTTGTMTLRGSHQLAGSYLGSANMLRSPPSPQGAGGPFTNGTLSLTRQ
jgi:type 1 fimbria pilin